MSSPSLERCRQMLDSYGQVGWGGEAGNRGCMEIIQASDGQSMQLT